MVNDWMPHESWEQLPRHTHTSWMWREDTWILGVALIGVLLIITAVWTLTWALGIYGCVFTEVGALWLAITHARRRRP